MEDILKAVEKLNLEQLTGFMNTILSYYVWKLLKFVIEIDDDRYRKHANNMIFDSFDTLMIVFRKRVLELNGKQMALRAINARLPPFQEYGLF